MSASRNSTPTSSTPLLERAVWCNRLSARADDRCERDHREHDHVDVVVHAGDSEQAGTLAYSLDPVGTTYLLPGGNIYSLAYYEDDFAATPEITDKIIPVYNIFTKNGGAASGERRTGLPEGTVRIILPTPATGPEAPRIAIGSLFVRPNGDTWRLTDYTADWGIEGHGSTPMWSVAYAKGSMSSGDTLPDDARLVWSPAPLF